MHSKSHSLKNHIICLLGKQYFESEREKQQFTQQIKNLWVQLHRIQEQITKSNSNSIALINDDTLEITAEITALMRQIQNRLKVLPMEPVAENKSYSTASRSTIVIAIFAVI